ncbi:MAG: CpaF family protein [Terriglobales bacterium]
MANLQTFERTEYQQVKADLHRKILDKLDLEKLGRTPSDAARDEVLSLIRSTVNTEAVPLSFAEREQLSREILDEIFGLGPLEPLLKDPTISDILVNRFDRVYVERAGKIELATIGGIRLSFKDDAHLMQIIDRIVSRVGRRVDESSPMVDARLADGSRVNAIIPPLAIDGPCLSIRRFGHDPLTARNMIENKSLSEPMLELLSVMVKGRLNLLVSGGTGAGKTTLLNVLSGYIPNSERIVTIEDAAELQMKQEHVVRLETRPPNIEGKGAVRQRQLVINSLRMRPDRIVVGEVRGEEAFDMLQAMNTGHEGSLTTVHANTPRDALARLENMFSMANLNLPERAMRHQIASAIHAVVQIARMSDGTRKVMSISEITGMEGEVIAMQELFVFERTGIDESGKVRGVFRALGIRPKFADRLATGGLRLRPALFDSRMEV